VGGDFHQLTHRIAVRVWIDLDKADLTGPYLATETAVKLLELCHTCIKEANRMLAILPLEEVADGTK
jgi:hypothetical protein